MDPQNEDKTVENENEGQAQGIDFVTLGMFIIGKEHFDVQVQLL
jgi:hypothetical protein